MIAVHNGIFQHCRHRTFLIPDHCPAQCLKDLRLRRFYLDIEILFLFSPVDGKHAVSGHPGKRLSEIIIHLIHGFSLFILCLHRKPAFFHRPVTDTFAVIGTVSHLLRYDIAGTGNGIPNGFHSLIRIHIRNCFFLYASFGFLQQYKICQRFQPFFFRDHSTGPFFWPERPVQVIHGHQRHRLGNLLPKLRR